MALLDTREFSCLRYCGRIAAFAGLRSHKHSPQSQVVGAPSVAQSWHRTTPCCRGEMPKHFLDAALSLGNWVRVLIYVVIQCYR